MLAKGLTTLVAQMACVFIVKTLFKCESVVQVHVNYAQDFNVRGAPSQNCVMSLVHKFDENCVCV
jgi:hypothetical protein